MDTTNKPLLTSISIGPGIRGIERGLDRIIRLREIAFVEIEAFIIENLVAEMEAGLLAPAVIWSDCKTFPSELFRGKVNIILAGYPCQPFSNAGNRKGTEDPRHLWPHIARTVDIIRPDICLFENVRGHVTLGLREVIGSLEQMGYRVHWGIFSAEETGASHKRERVFIMAVRKDMANDYGKRESQPERFIKDIGGRFIDESECLENTKHTGMRGRNNEDFNWGCKVQIEGSGIMGNSESQFSEQPGNTRAGRTGFTNDGFPELGNSNNPRLQRWISGISQECSGERITGPDGSLHRESVARPGQPQYEWESPRTTTGQWETKSCVGGRVNGYSFREDFLRALGNSVYPDSAELAFITLMQKFL